MRLAAAATRLRARVVTLGRAGVGAPGATPAGRAVSARPDGDVATHLAVVRVAHLARLVSASVVAYLVARQMATTGPAGEVQRQWLLWTAGLWCLTIGATGFWLGRLVDGAKTLRERHLLASGALDVVWLVLGYAVTGYSAVPFPPLLVLVIAVYGTLLGAGRTFALTVLAGMLFVLAQVWAVAIRGDAFGTNAQATLFIAIGVVSAVVGNRVRAASWTVRQLHDTVRELARQNRAVLDHLPIGVVWVGPDRGAGEGNAAAQTLLCLPADTAHTATALAQAVPALGTAVEDALRDPGPSGAGTARRGEAVLTDAAGGGERWVQWLVVGRDVPNPQAAAPAVLTAAPAGLDSLANPAAAPLVRRALVLVWDMSDQRAADELRRRAERFAAIAELSAGLAHEVRNPIAALRSAAEQLAVGPEADEDDRTLLRIVVTQADRLERLVSEFLEFARVGGKDVGAHDLARVVADAVALASRAVAPAKVLRFEAELPPTPVHTDGDLVFRVVSNLVLNAAQFAPPGGCVRISFVRDPAGRHLALAVADDGPGVPPERRERIFAPFFTTRAEGSGLGLAVAARAAALLGGTLACAPPPSGAGGYFVFTLPATDTPPARA